MTKKRIIVYSSAVLILAIVGIFGVNYWRIHRAVEAVAGFPYQVGLTGTLLSKCVPKPPAGVCLVLGDPVGTEACNTKGPYVCGKYTYVSGWPAGGMPPYDVLLPDEIVAFIGLVPGAPYIGGGISPVLMESGVSASIGGAFSPMLVSSGKSFPSFAYFMKKAFDDVKFSIAGGKR